MKSSSYAAPCELPGGRDQGDFWNMLQVLNIRRKLDVSITKTHLSYKIMASFCASCPSYWPFLAASWDWKLSAANQNCRIFTASSFSMYWEGKTQKRKIRLYTDFSISRLYLSPNYWNTRHKGKKKPTKETPPPQNRSTCSVNASLQLTVIWDWIIFQYSFRGRKTKKKPNNNNKKQPLHSWMQTLVNWSKN